MEMTPEEIQLTHEAIQELKNSGIIVQDSTQREDVFQILTAKGKEIVEKQHYDTLETHIGSCLYRCPTS